MRAKRRKAERAGRRAEWLAAGLLIAKGYRVLAQRLRTPFGEVDLVVRRGRVLVFVEVKHRKNGADTFTLPPAQADRMVRAANWLVGQGRWSFDETRFDLILLGGRIWPRHEKAIIMTDAPGRRIAP